MQTLQLRDVYSQHLVESALERELRIIKNGLKITNKNLKNFEEKFNLSSHEFYQKYQSGKMGDDADVMRWAMEIQAKEKLTKDYQKLSEVKFVS
jgi:hypothetical protein